MATDIPCLREALEELDRIAPGAPLLALGQTVFWDEPMKGGIALAARRMGFDRRFVAGVHDTDYFAKLPHGKRQPGRFRTVPHNDGSTRGLWSAAGEFSVLFGSETVVTRDLLAQGGLRSARLAEERPGFLDEATEAWGWRGIVSLDDHAPITADVPLRAIFRELHDTLDWALDTSADFLAGSSHEGAKRSVEEIRSRFCDAGEQIDGSAADFYRALLPAFYSFAASSTVDLEATATTELLRFNRQTCHLPRFELLRFFVDSRTRKDACRAYDDAIREAPGLYELARFGSGAIPFDLVIPGEGRGTIRIGNRGAVIMTRKPKFLSFKKPLESLEEFAAMVEAKFGQHCAVVGKAVTLIGLLAREFVFVFHEGASGYVKHSRTLHRLLNERLGADLRIHPILRARYESWDALSVCCSWLKLPGPLHRPFGTDEVCAPSLAGRWRQVGEEQRNLLKQLGSLRRPIDLIRFLDQTQGGFWQCLANEYGSLQSRLETLQRDLDSVHRRRHDLYDRIRQLRRDRVAAEKAKGDQFRARIWEKEPTAEDLAERERLSHEVERLIHERVIAEAEMRHLRKEQNDLLQNDEVQRVHARRRAIELEAELRRLKLIREAVLASQGLAQANRRPSAWWFPLVCPDGLWFWQTIGNAEYYLEPLV